MKNIVNKLLYIRESSIWLYQIDISYYINMQMNTLYCSTILGSIIRGHYTIIYRLLPSCSTTVPTILRFRQLFILSHVYYFAVYRLKLLNYIFELKNIYYL